jgi:hypothetical protein
MQNFDSPDFIQTDLDKFSTFFQDFLKKILKFSNSEKSFQKASFTKTWVLFLLTPEFSQEISKFQNYKVHQSCPNDEG